MQAVSPAPTGPAAFLSHRERGGDMQSMIDHTGFAGWPCDALASTFGGRLTADRALPDRGDVG